MSSPEFAAYLSTATAANVADREANMQRLRRWFNRNYWPLLKGVTRDARILEIGPGLGEFLRFMQEKGFANVKAIDISPEVVEHCNALVPNSTLLVDDPGAHFRAYPNFYRVVFMCQVIEHVPRSELPMLLDAIHGSLVENGVLIVETPNMENLITSNHFRYGDYTHVDGFTASSLAQVMRICGFSQSRQFCPRHPNSSPGRFLQNVLHGLIESIQGLLLRAYLPRRQPLLGPHLTVVALK